LQGDRTHAIRLSIRLKPWDYTVATVPTRPITERRNISLSLALALMSSAVLTLCASVALAASMQAKPTNVVEADAASIAAGKKLFGSNCASCHGETAQGDGKAGRTLNPKPPSLVDATWIHGSSDGEIFTVIRDGVKDTGMKGFASRMTTHQIWDVVNYLRSIGPDTPNTPR
jgi:mono/diheme cytochrome c family protein